MNRHETGAMTTEVNDLILYADNTQELAEMRDAVYKSFYSKNGGKQNDAELAAAFMNSRFITCAHKNYQAEVNTLNFSPQLKDDFCRIYALEYTQWVNDRKSTLIEPNISNELSTGAIAILKRCTVQGNVIKLPAGTLDRKLFLEVKNKLELI